MLSSGPGGQAVLPDMAWNNAATARGNHWLTWPLLEVPPADSPGGTLFSPSSQIYIYHCPEYHLGYFIISKLEENKDLKA